MRLLKFIIIVFSVCIMLSLTACGGGDESSSAAGSLSLKLTDATTNDYKAVYVTIKEVQVCTDDENDGDENSWYTVAEPQSTYNLLELVNGVQAQLGVTDLDAGYYTQMRLIIGTEADGELNILGVSHPPTYYGNYIIDNDEVYHKLKIPSGIKTGIKLVSGFEIYENQTTELLLDFDASRSVVQAGNSGKWLLKPTIKVIGTAIAISGTVTGDGGSALEGVSVSAQEYNFNGDEVTVHAATITNENGEYVLFVEPYVYNLVAYGEGYDPQCSYIEVVPDVVYTEENFVLASATMGTLSGSVSVDTLLKDPYLSISVRQLIECEQETIMIEVISFNIAIADDQTYSVELPGGSYKIVAETAGYQAQVLTVEISETETTTSGINFE